MNFDRESTYALIGAGVRGADVYARYLHEHPELGTLVAVGEPRDHKCNVVAVEHGIASENVFPDWRELLKKKAKTDRCDYSSVHRQVQL